MSADGQLLVEASPQQPAQQTADQAAQRTAFRVAEKRYQLHKDQLLVCK